MASLLFTEFLKLKRSKMFLISILGAAVAPFMVVVATWVQLQTKANPPVVLFEQLFYETNLYVVLVIGVPLYGVVTAYLFSREYQEDTLKNLLTIPVSRMSYLLSKLLMLLMWIIALTLVAWSLTLVLGLLTRFDGFSGALVLQSLQRFVTGGLLLFILSMPTVLITLVLKNYVPTIIFTIVITMINIMGANSEHRDLFPWAAVQDITNQSLLPTYPAFYTYALIAAASLGGLAAILIYFRRTDIH
ncbi:ABC transporter permease [Paenibacillus lutrae]|uniref:ABC transporter permease subunit n=1 Tax=Paenibacillus lutrae TaxID=2078573 RepID=A0A7X3JYM3_9BACL|nr:ABC transporter permease [Paenibacillus lutrae]MVO99060.1 ABC transporter permease subunit [Paenibacillus lutrae]